MGADATTEIEASASVPTCRGCSLFSWDAHQFLPERPLARGDEVSERLIVPIEGYRVGSLLRSNHDMGAGVRFAAEQKRPSGHGLIRPARAQMALRILWELLHAVEPLTFRALQAAADTNRFSSTPDSRNCVLPD
jgi:hypothetical protein